MWQEAKANPLFLYLPYQVRFNVNGPSSKEKILDHRFASVKTDWSFENALS
jgi:hypothetical protein